MFQEIPEGLKWIVGTVGVLLAAIGGSKVWDLVGAKRARRNVLDDRAVEIHESTESKRIDERIAGQSELGRQLDRLEKRFDGLQERFDKLQEAHTSLMAENAELKAENRHLKERLTEVVKESEDRRDRIRSLEAEVRKLQGEVAELIAIRRGEM